jgi:hypothetical protein
MKGIVVVAVASSLALTTPDVRAQGPLRPQSFVYENPYMVFTAPLGWVRRETTGEVDSSLTTLRLTAPDGKMFIEIYPAHTITRDPAEYMKPFLKRYVDGLAAKGREPRTRTLDIRNAYYTSAAADFKVFAPQKDGPLTVDQFTAFECYGFARYGWLQRICTFAVDEHTLAGEGSDAKARVEFLKSLRPNYGTSAVAWSPKTDKEPQ